MPEPLSARASARGFAKGLLLCGGKTLDYVRDEGGVQEQDGARRLFPQGGRPFAMGAHQERGQDISDGPEMVYINGRE